MSRVTCAPGQLDRLIDGIAAALEEGLDATTVIEWLIVEHGARYRSRWGFYWLHLAGVTATCMHPGVPLLDAWMRDALQRIARDSRPWEARR